MNELGLPPPEIDSVYNVFCYYVSYNSIRAATRVAARIVKRTALLLLCGFHNMLCFLNEFHESNMFPLGLR